jgi:hypothetical protein
VINENVVILFSDKSFLIFSTKSSGVEGFEKKRRLKRKGGFCPQMFLISEEEIG